jgi:hypothetical protein
MTTPRIEIDEERRRIYLECLARTGSPSYAASQATPWAKGGGRTARQSFYSLEKSDPEFAQLAAAARQEAIGRLEAAIAKRAIEGYARPVFQRGEKVGEEIVFSDVLALRMAAALSPERWTDRSKTEVSGRVAHVHAGIMLEIRPEDVLLLPQEDQRVLVRLLAQIEELKNPQERKLIADGQRRT